MSTKTAAPKTAAPKAGIAKQSTAAASKTETKSIAPAESVADGAKVALSLRVKDLIERVSAAGEFKKKDVRDIVEATLVELGRALEDGYSLNLPPFGKMHIRNNRTIDNGATAMTLKLRRGPSKPAESKAEKEGLAEADEAV